MTTENQICLRDPRTEPVWSNWRKLLARLRVLAKEQKKQQPTGHRFNMAVFMSLDIQRHRPAAHITLGRIKRGSDCGSAACLFGEAVLACGDLNRRFPIADGMDLDLTEYAKDLLGVYGLDASYVYRGHWVTTNNLWILSDVTLDQAIEYVTKVLATKDIYQEVA